MDKIALHGHDRGRVRPLFWDVQVLAHALEQGCHPGIFTILPSSESDLSKCVNKPGVHACDAADPTHVGAWQGEGRVKERVHDCKAAGYEENWCTP
jgi:hypothetical protein